MDEHRRTESERGSTFVEALVALSLLALVSGGAVAPARTAAAALRRAQRLAREDHALILADDLLRCSLGRVRFPVRARFLAVTRLPRGLRLGFLDGDPERSLELSIENGSLVVCDGVSVTRVHGFSSGSFRFLSREAADGRPLPAPVVCARLRSAGGECVEICANVGSWPLLPPRVDLSGGG